MSNINAYTVAGRCMGSFKTLYMKYKAFNRIVSAGNISYISYTIFKK